MKAPGSQVSLWPKPKKGTVDRNGVVPLLIEILRELPKLEGAACRNHPPSMFDAEDADGFQIEEAVQICFGCPCYEALNYFALSPRTDVIGVVGGELLLVADMPNPRIRPA